MKMTREMLSIFFSIFFFFEDKEILKFNVTTSGYSRMSWECT